MHWDAGTIYLIIAFVLAVVSAIKDSKKTRQALIITGKIALTVFPVLFLIFVLMGTIQAFISKELIASLIGSGSSFLGILIGEVIGCIALIQPAAVYPFAGFLHDSGASYGSIVAFVMTSILIGISTLPLEIKLLGKKFTLVRNILVFIFVFFIGIIFMVVL